MPAATLDPSAFRGGRSVISFSPFQFKKGYAVGSFGAYWTIQRTLLLFS